MKTKKVDENFPKSLKISKNANNKNNNINKYNINKIKQ
jgi:hypothetical protein